MADVRIASISGLRGLVGRGLDPAFVSQFTAAYCAECGPGSILVGNDGRPTADVFRHVVLAAITASGHDAHDCGPVATPTLGFLTRERRASGAIQISASHNPPEYNGLKLFQPHGMVLGRDAGQRVLNRVAANECAWASWNAVGRVIPVTDPLSAHLERVLELVDVAAIQKRAFVVALDSSHGSGGALGASLLERLGCRVLHFGAAPDGRYEHPPEPTAENLADFARVAVEHRVDVAFAQDPDADRLAIVDNQGRYIGEELTIALAALRRLDSATGPLVVNLSTSRLIDEIAAPRNAPVLRTPVGEIQVVEAMQHSGAILGGEGNGGVIDPRVGFVRDSFVGMALILDLLANRAQTLAEIVDALPQYVMIKDKYALADLSLADCLARLARAFPDATRDSRDGLRLDWPDRWVHVRGSNTEPIVRVIAEAPTLDRARGLAADTAQRMGLANND